MLKWDNADWYVEYQELAAVHRPGDNDLDDQEPDWTAWRVRVRRIHDDVLDRIANAQAACELRQANPDRTWEEIASGIGWRRSISLLKAACEWLDKIEPEKRQAIPGCKKPSSSE